MDENVMETSLPVQQEKEPQNLWQHLVDRHGHWRPGGFVICGLGTKEKKVIQVFRFIKSYTETGNELSSKTQRMPK